MWQIRWCFWSATHVVCSAHALSVMVCLRLFGGLQRCTGHKGTMLRPPFFKSCVPIRSGRIGPWLVAGDFNLIYKAEDKNNQRLNM
jgi:hypothetical protein